MLSALVALDWQNDVAVLHRCRGSIAERRAGDGQMIGSYDDAVPACCCEGGPEPKSKVVDLPANYFKWREWALSIE